MPPKIDAANSTSDMLSPFRRMRTSAAASNASPPCWSFESRTRSYSLSVLSGAPVGAEDEMTDVDVAVHEVRPARQDADRSHAGARRGLALLRPTRSAARSARPRTRSGHSWAARAGPAWRRREGRPPRCGRAASRRARPGTGAGPARRTRTRSTRAARLAGVEHEVKGHAVLSELERRRLVTHLLEPNDPLPELLRDAREVGIALRIGDPERLVVLAQELPDDLRRERLRDARPDEGDEKEPFQRSWSGPRAGWT